MDYSKFKKFDGANWHPYKTTLRAYLLSIGAIQLLDDNASPGTTTEEQTAFAALNVKLFCYIIFTLAEPQMQHLSTVQEGDGISAFKALEKIYDSKSSNSIIQGLEEVVGSKQNGQPAIY